MSIVVLMTYIGIAALILSVIQIFGFKVHRIMLMTFAQNFAGILFLFSGWVKAVDPLGTAFKMEDYFAEFYTTFQGTALSFIAPLFPFLSQYSTAFAIFMIILEMVLGLMLLMGDRPKFTAWAFFLLVLFFTFLTGFTYLTGYVSGDVNFFDFAKWGAYKETNMRVTDCGCFGDFIKLKPKISFYKDLFLLLPSLYFLFRSKDMHTVWNSRTRNWILGISTLGLLIYCIYNFHWNEPHVDFRPFKNGTDVAAIKKMEEDARASVRILAMKLKNKTTGEIIEVKYDEYLKNLAQYADTHETVEQIKTDLEVEETKISHFEITDFEGNDFTDKFIGSKDAHLMIMSFHPEYNVKSAVRTVQDSIFKIDTLKLKVDNKDTISTQKTFVEVKSRQEEYFQTLWEPEFLDRFVRQIKPLVDDAAKDKVKASIVISGIDEEKAMALKEISGINASYLTADEKLLKTIMRSNPGIILWRDGVLLHKWHIKKLPDWQEIKKQYLE
jgi:uncharacterized membrane protein YphA (DoxX/SURF4 family)